MGIIYLLFSYFILTKSSIVFENGNNCDIYQLSNNNAGPMTNKMVYIADTCLPVSSVKENIVLTDFGDCSPEIKEKNILNAGASVLVIRSLSILEDTIWNSRYFFLNGTVLFILSDCSIDISKYSEEKNAQVEIEPNVTITIYLVLLAIGLELWNLINGLLCISNIYRLKRKIHTYFLIYLYIELILFIVRIFLFIEPVPYRLLHTYMSYNVFSGINFSLGIGSIFFICYCLLESLYRNKNLQKEFFPEYGTSYIRYVMDKFKIQFLVILLTFVFTMVLTVIKGNYQYVVEIERTTLVFYLVSINIIFLIFLWTFIEMYHTFEKKFMRTNNINTKSNRRGLMTKIRNCGISLVVILIGMVIYLLIPSSYSIVSLKILVLWSGFLLLSTSNILICHNIGRNMSLHSGVDRIDSTEQLHNLSHDFALTNDRSHDLKNVKEEPSY